ncbi:hypothetical protein Tasa_038_042 [Tanticharoenia sakaeratensis NBRC 103193]|uniref:Uncharacterized protein n=1 Tax=Tanticharoenia sakaeratensis NBRC 103193 TaxID=1231623 RepID=A0A0D6MNN5_9PROT|nr:hypothetical protein Tasa_038_042 [Tanticharoenia sakaeratensis NBRC 103193]GBQ20101.1 hypothetical protein AA103193_1266 [Tanticharoenia sakaeratensis NBRC 103193]
MALGHVDRVALPPVQSKDDAARDPFCGEVDPSPGKRQYLLDFWRNACKSGPHQGLPNPICFPLRQCRQGKLLDGAASAGAEQRAGRHNPIRGGRFDLDQIGWTVAKPHARLFARQSAGHEHATPFDFGHAVTGRAEAEDG